MKLMYDPSKPGEVLFPEFIWKSKTNKVLLTFDDGPNPGTTEAILKTLQKLKISALFFMVGNNIKRYPTLTNELLSEGHEFGNHTFNHKNLQFAGKSTIYNEISAFNKISNEVIGRQTSYFRPPKGRFNHLLPGELKKFGLKNVMWSLLTFDYKNDLNIVKFAIKNFICSNSLVVLHDSNKSKKIIEDSIELLAEEITKLGYEFGTPFECLN